MYHGKMTKIRDISKHSVIDIDIRNIYFLIYIHVYIDHWEIHHIGYWPPLRPGWGLNSRPLEGTLLTISGHRADLFVIFARPKSRFWWRTVLSAGRSLNGRLRYTLHKYTQFIVSETLQHLINWHIPAHSEGYRYT